MDDEQIYKKIQEQIKTVFGISKIDKNTSINSFNAVSEDNEHFLKLFQEEFQVDMSGFNYYEFFEEDQFYLLAFVRLFKRLFGFKRKIQELTINHLLFVAKYKKWRSPS